MKIPVIEIQSSNI